MQVESLDVEADDYVVMDRTALAQAWDPSDDGEDESQLDPLLPPLHRLLINSESATDSTSAQATSFSHETITIVAQLDRLNPLTEARWVKTGDVDNWILSLGIANGANPKDTDRLSEWRNKIKVVDPDPVRFASTLCVLAQLPLTMCLDLAAPYDPERPRVLGGELECRLAQGARRVRQDPHVQHRQRCISICSSSPRIRLTNSIARSLR